jgi:peptide-methionine (S)-S-oxide reductase
MTPVARRLLLRTTAAALLLLATLTQAQPAPPARATAIFAGGCFWCMEPAFENVKGVVSAVSGYTGGATKNPTYEQVSDGGTGHYESVLVTYDPRQVSYAKLLDVFWHNVDPLNPDGQFCDNGDQYRAAIFYRTEGERQLAEQSRNRLMQARHWNIVTAIRPAAPFYRAEEYHQDYSKKNPVRYKFYRFNCGRDHRLGQLWGSSPH